ncbi:hypothetical protein OHB04_02190 [Streptomyces sp. NBC_01775]|uniref:hypothetical protein n=1 Tax=Streptomyces sp. NBC_01775 TaxID=2975939 RepID=UPI002DD8DC60|nr:hypothetical protein [Streptomyces sp. NBC_01775]WSB74702.1 hypothetical protein OHB04_02190 [Streptomyces sp. NBC_01775]
MASVIDPDRHSDLIRLQLAVFQADRELYTYTGDDAGPLREKVRQAAAIKDAALRESGLVTEHGWYTAEQDLKRAGAAETAG